MKKILVCLALAGISLSAKAQFSRHIIQFKNKANTPNSFNTPTQYLSQRAIDRRTRYGIAIDSTDLPVTPRYLDSLRAAGAVTILNVSRWLNQVSIQTTDAAALQKINSFPFVENVRPIAARVGNGSGRRSTGKEEALKEEARFNSTADFFNYGASYNQIHIHNGEFLHNIGLRGQNMIISMFDAGFRSYTSLRSFDSVNANGQVLGTWDFVSRETSVVEDDAHGMQCFSVIAANIPGQFVGAAPKASFYLFRSEDPFSEYPIEEHNWVCAAERADSAGSDLISSSLGYSDGMSNPSFNHTYAEMNGNTTIAARGADLAAKKGLLVANSAGNDGGGSFNYIATPADGDSVMAVGAVTVNGVPAGFSSYGPSFDGQVKPDVASVGVATVVQTTGNTVGASNGTSFSCPNMAGLAACLWQGFKEFNNIRILDALRQAGSKASAPDDRVGYGIPDVRKATMMLLKDFATASVTNNGCKNTLTWKSKDVSSMRYEIERRLPGETDFTKIGERQGTGNDFAAPRNHSFSDSLVNISAGEVTYRIRQVIDTATAGFTADIIGTTSVNVATTCTATAPTNDEIILMPNPANKLFSVKLTTNYAIPNLIIRVIDANGKTIMLEKRGKSAGTAKFDFPAHALSSGKYFVSLFNNDKHLGTRELLKL